MSKQLTMWCAFDEKETPIPESLERTRNQCVRSFFETKKRWDYWRKERGHSCRKVRVTIEEVKP